MKRFALLFSIYLLFTIPAHTQLIREWKTVANGSFTGSDFIKNLAVSQGKYAAALSRGYTLDSIVQYPVMISGDGGYSWKGITPDSDFNKSGWSNIKYKTVEMPSSNLIIIIGSHYRKDDYYPMELSFVCRSTDFGQTWEIIPTPQDTIVSYRNSISMYDDNVGMMIFRRIATEDNQQTQYIYKTSDGGKTWTELNVNIKYPEAIKCISAINWVVGSIDGLYVTKDGGNTWILQPKPDGNLNYSFLNESIWIASGTGKKDSTDQTPYVLVYKTMDAGLNWKLQSYSLPNPYYFSSDFYDEFNGIGISAVYGEVVRTTDAGNTWVTETLPSEAYSEAFSQVKFVNKEQAIILAISRIYLYTGKMVLTPPTAKYIKESTGLIDYSVYWIRIVGGDKFKLQISESKPSSLPYYSIPDFEKKLIINTDIITDTVFDLKGKIKFNKDYHIRVKTYSDTIQSDWSKMISFRTQADTAHYPKLDTCILVDPPQYTIDLPLTYTFKWNKVKDAEKYTLNVATVLNYSLGGYDFVVEDLKDTSFTIGTMQAGYQHLWWVVAEAEKKENSVSDLGVFFTKSYAGISDNSNNEQLQIFPNPVESALFLNYPDNLRNIKISIYSIEGIKMLETFITSQINVSGWLSGIYFLKAGDKIIRFIKI